MRRTALAATIAFCFAAALLLSQVSAAAAPRTLTLAYARADRSAAYLSLVKPFVDAINDDPRNLLKIVARLGRDAGTVRQQPYLVSSGQVDIAFIIPGIDAKLFPDESVVELPGLFRDTREATMVHTRLVAGNAPRGYRDFYVIGAVATQPETIRGRKPTASLADLKGQTLRVNNPLAGDAIARLGAASKVLSLNDTADAISSGAPPALVMNRAVFDGLPEEAKALIRAHSGAWLAERYVAIANAANQRVLDQLRADKRRTVTASVDLETVQRAYAAVTEQWAAASPHRRALLDVVKSEIAKLSRPK